MTTGTLLIEDVTKRFQGLTALDGVSATIKADVPTGIIGPNGSGKTTLFNVVTGFHKPESGKITWQGRDITGWQPHRIAQAGLVRTFQQRMAFPRLSVTKNIEVAAIAAGLRGPRCSEAIEDALRLMRIEQYSEEQAGTLPFGINRRVGIACTLPLRPSLILLDEPAAGLSNDETDDLAISLHAVQSRGQGICLVDHNMEFVSEFCRHIIVLDTGRNLTEGTPAQVMHDEQVARVYLGHAAER